MDQQRRNRNRNGDNETSFRVHVTSVSLSKQAKINPACELAPIYTFFLQSSNLDLGDRHGDTPKPISSLAQEVAHAGPKFFGRRVEQRLSSPIGGWVWG
jgi:hypothetical protein